MAYVPLERFMFRAPLLPVGAVRDRGLPLLDHPLGATALALASPELTAALGRGGRDSSVQAALDRYRRRAAFRPTPHGLLAGVGVGSLGARTHVRTGAPAAALRVAWWRLADLARALVDLPAVREQVRLRRAPSLILGAHTLLWLGPGQDGLFIEEKRADLDVFLTAILDATQAWTPWPSVRAAAAGTGDGLIDDGQAGDGAIDADEIDDLLVTLIDDGLLHVDLTPPLVGPDPADWMRERVARLPGASDIATQLAAAADAARAGDLGLAQERLSSLPGRRPRAPGLDATLVFPVTPPLTLARAAIERAAALAPLLFRLQQALAPPISERTPRQAASDALDATTEIFGAGAVDVGAFALGDYGVAPAGDADLDGDDDGDDPDPPAPQAEPDRALTAFLVERLTEGARRRARQLDLPSAALSPLLPEVALPPTCELFLTPRRARAGKPAGDGWLLGLHAPAGASWGRFGHALGDLGASLLEPLREAERLARPGEEAVDVVFSPSDALGDVCAHPPLRRTALALTGWPADDRSAVTPSDLELCADAAALEPLALRASGGPPIAPAPLHRVRSTTAPPGIWRLLTGWSLVRQHAPWAFTWGPLGDLDVTPRVAIDGFVVTPASWRLPPPLIARAASGRALQTWRRRAGVPRFVQVGSEDELLPVDLASPGAAADLVGRERVFEIWPPLGDTPDRSGRRLEAVVALGDRPGTDRRARISTAIAATAAAGEVPPPRHTPRAMEEDGWRTFKLFGATDRQNAVLLGAVQPAIEEARRAGELTGWFFLRYVDGPGRRPHLRVRARVAGAAEEAAFAARLRAHLAPAIETGDVVSIERAPYFPEAARYGGVDALPVLHALFAADSTLACALIAAAGAGPVGPVGPYDADPAGVPNGEFVCFLVATFDALARGLGLSDAARRDLGRRRRAAHAAELSVDAAAVHARELRLLLPRLRKLLTACRAEATGAFRDGGDPVAALHAYHASVRDALAGAPLPGQTRDRIVPSLPSLLHLSAVRLVGLGRRDEIRAYTFWERTLDSLEHHRGPS